MDISPAPNARLLIKLPLRVKSRKFQCKDCLAQFDRTEHLSRHSRKHTGVVRQTYNVQTLTYISNRSLIVAKMKIVRNNSAGLTICFNI